jgi:hypothetical protein
MSTPEKIMSLILYALLGCGLYFLPDHILFVIMATGIVFIAGFTPLRK